MKITIDTKEDSHQEIRKVIKMLSSLVGEKEIFSNQKDVFSDDKEESVESDDQSSGIFNMFGSSTEKKSEDGTTEETKEEVVDLGIPKIEEYD